jgi:hypothetical protein
MIAWHAAFILLICYDAFLPCLDVVLSLAQSTLSVAN